MNGKQWIGMMFFGGGIFSAIYVVIKAEIFVNTPMIPMFTGFMILIGAILLMCTDT